MTVLEADTAAGVTSGLDDVASALASARLRLLDLSGRLSKPDWEGPSRCHLWNVHEVLRHVRDACRLHVGHLLDDDEQKLTQPFDARTTPLRWLERSEGEAPATTVGDLRGLSAAEGRALAARVAERPGHHEMGPYGPVHWSILSAHVFWDAWLHERDMFAALEAEGGPIEVEEGVVALYALLIASVPALVNGTSFAVTVALTGASGRGYLASVTPGRVVLHPGASTDDADLRGALPATVDSLAGRGPELDQVLTGDPALLVPFRWLRSVLAPPT